jgi:hypothetical protein
VREGFSGRYTLRNVPASTRRVLFLSLTLIGLIAVLVIVDLSTVNTENKSCPSASPEAVVRAYYAAAARGDGQAAEACFTVALRKVTAVGVDPDWQNIKSMQLLSVTEFPLAPVHRPAATWPPFRATGYRVEYVASWKSHMTDRDGLGVRFVSVVQVDRDSPWRIDSIGSGP